MISICQHPYETILPPPDERFLGIRSGIRREYVEFSTYPCNVKKTEGSVNHDEVGAMIWNSSHGTRDGRI